MVTWLTRSLLFIVAGAVLAYAVTAHNDTIDLQTTGVILLLVGVFDLLLNFGLTMYYRQPTHSYQRLEERPAAYEQRAYEQRAYQPQPRAYQTRPYPELDDDRYATRPIRRDNPDWH